jgi:hypothetical protein
LQFSISTQCLRSFSAVSTIAQQSSNVMAAGTSVAACLPFFIADRQHGHVPFPRRRRVDEIEILGLAQPLEVARSLVVDGRWWMAGARDLPGGPVGAFRTDVADGGNKAAGNANQILDVTAALQANADVANADGLNRRRRELTAVGCLLDDRRLTRGARRPLPQPPAPQRRFSETHDDWDRT